jgi:hypothetical protein
MAKRGESKNIIVGAAQVFIADENLEYFTTTDGVAVNGVYFPSTVDSTERGLPAFVANTKYADTLEAASTDWTNVGYTNNGLELQFQPDFGEVQVDQLLDVAKLYKQGMQVTLNTSMAEATLENLLVAVAAPSTDLTGTAGSFQTLELSAGELGGCPVERALVAVGPGTGDCSATGGDAVERVYFAYRALSIDSVTVSAKRDEATAFAVSFRLLPVSNGKYGKVVDRKVSLAS